MAELNDLLVKGDARFLGKVYMKDYIDSRTYSGIYGSANDQDNASFYFGYVRPTNFYDVWKVGYKVYASVPGQNNYRLYSEVEWYGNQNGVSFKVFNRLYSTSYRCYLYHNAYYLTSTGYTNGYSHALGIGLRGSTNPTSSNYPRTFKIELVYTENCVFTFLDSMVKRTSIPGAGATNFQEVAEANGGDNGLQETGDSTNIWQLRHNGGNFITSTALGRYVICLQKNETTLVPTTAVNNDTGTTKTLTTDSFNPFGQILFYNSTTALSADASVSAGALYEQITLDLRYSFNCGQTLTSHKDLFIVVSPQSNGMVKLHSTPLAQDLPTTEDNLLYILLGRTYSTYQIELYTNHPVYEYKDGALRQYTNSVGTTYEDATTTTHGLMSAVDKVKLNSIATGAEVNQIEVVKVNGTAKSITNKTVDITIPTKTSDLTNDSNFMSGMTILAYGKSTWNDFITAYTNKHIVYCRASSNSNPATGSQTRMAFMAYVNNAENPTNVEFQYYRSMSSHSATNQGDQVYIYKLESANGGKWTVTIREASTKIVAGTNMSSTYSNGTLTLSATDTTYSNATTSSAGLMSAADKANLDKSYSVTFGVEGIGLDVVEDWSATKHYHKGDFAIIEYSGSKILTYCIVNSATYGEFSLEEWTPCSLWSLLTDTRDRELSLEDYAFDEIGALQEQKENTSNKVTSISSSSTNTQYPSALAVYNYINSLNGNGVSY